MEIGLSAGDAIDVLEAHTAGEAQNVIQTFKVAGSPMLRNVFKQ